MTELADLHLHSFFSDGTDSPEHLMDRAMDCGLGLVSLTDHDGIDGLERAEKKAVENGILFIPGIEFSSKLFAALAGFEKGNYYMHILGYGINPENEDLKKACSDVKNKRKIRNLELLAAFEEKGCRISYEELCKDSQSDFIGKVDIARILVKRSVCKTVDEAFRREDLLLDPKIRAIRKDKLDAEHVISLIHRAGGKAFLAHPFQFTYSGEKNDSVDIYIKKLEAALDIFDEMGLDGIEFAYPTHDEMQMDLIKGWAKKHGFLCSRGSDDHGEGLREKKQMQLFIGGLEDGELSWAFEMAEGISYFKG